MIPPLPIAFCSSPVITLVSRSEFPYTDEQVRVIKLSGVINHTPWVAYHITVVNFTPTTSIVPLTIRTEQVCITVPTDSRLPNSGERLCGLYDVRPASFGLVDNVVTRASHYGKPTEVFKGVDVTVNARFAEGGLLSGGVSVGRMVTDNCYLNEDPSLTAQVFPGVTALPATSLLPKVSAFCHVAPPWSQATQVKFMAVYPLPWGVQTSAIYQNSSGIPVTASYVATNAEIRPSLGRDLGSCRGAATCAANVTVELLPPNTVFEPRLQQVDLRFSKIVRLGRTRRLRGDVDVYNILNASNVLNMNTTYSPPGGVWQDVTQILGGRLVRLGARFDF